MNESFKERRKYLRIYRNFILTYQEKGKSDVYGTSQVNNVSQGGLSFSSTTPLPQGALVLIDLKTPFISDSIQLEGVVLESREKIEGMIYEIRVQFNEVPATVLTVLEKIEEYSKSSEAE